MLQHPTLEKLQALKFTGMVAALADQIAIPTSTNSASRSASACWWTGRSPNARTGA